MLLLFTKPNSGKTAKLIVTMSTPKWYYWHINRSPEHNEKRIGLLEFFGIKLVEIIVFSGIKTQYEANRKNWLEEVLKLGLPVKIRRNYLLRIYVL